MFKKILAVVLSASMAIAMVGCGNTATTDEGKVKLADYKGLVVYHDDIEVTDASYKQMVDYMLQQDATTKTVKKGTVTKTSTANVDYTGKIVVNGKKVTFDGGTASAQDINLSTDSANYITGFTKALIGKKVGDKFTVKLKFPKDYSQTTTVNKKSVKLANKEVYFTFKINSLKVTTTPELTDKYVTEKYGAYGVKDIAGFKKYATEQMKISNIMNKVWSTYKDKCKVVSYNTKEEESMKSYYGDYYEQQLQQTYNTDLKTYLEACSMSESDWNKQIKENVESTLKEQMIVKAIAEKEGLTPSDKEYKAEAQTLAEQNSASVSEIESQYGKDQVEYAVIYQRVQKFIADNVTEKKGTEPTTVAETTKAAETTATAETTTK